MLRLNVKADKDLEISNTVHREISVEADKRQETKDNMRIWYCNIKKRSL